MNEQQTNRVSGRRTELLESSTDCNIIPLRRFEEKSGRAKKEEEKSFCRRRANIRWTRAATTVWFVQTYTIVHSLVREILLNVFWEIPLAGGQARISGYDESRKTHIQGCSNSSGNWLHPVWAWHAQAGFA